ncbi:PLP-dependent transferase [Hypoxylon sp. NC1633]|nr:PLP-dependent transferase [Hypoxylon sp. NC1633]
MPETSKQLENTLSALLNRRESQGRLRRLSITSASCVDFSSNGYLSLSTNQEVQKSLIARLHFEVTRSEDKNTSHGPRRSILGSGGSRLLDGNSEFAESLEAKISAFHGAEAALLFTSAYDANTGLLGSVPQPGDVIVYDELIHASVHDGMRMSRATKRIPFAHDSISEICQGQGNSVGEGHQSKNRALDDILRQLSEDERIKGSTANVFICVEGLYSMDGDVVHLQKVIEAVDRFLPAGNGYIIVDEVHSVGIFGDKGRGLVCQHGLEDRVWARVFGFGKAMGCAGGVVLCSSTTRSYLINYARSLIYTTSMAFTSLASIDVVYDYLISGQSEPLRQHLETLFLYTHRQLLGLRARLQPGRPVFHIRETLSKSPIIPVFTIDPRGLAEHCQQSGFMVRPIVAPTVPAGSERVRICLHSANTTEQVDGLCSAIEVWVRSQMVAKGAYESKTCGGKIVDDGHVFTGQDKPRL